MVESVETPQKPERYYHKGLNALKFWLMPFVCFASFGFAVPYGNMISRLSLFASIAFYILCGFTSAAGEQQPGYSGRVLKRTAIRFFLLLGLFLLCNLALYGFTGTLPNILSAIARKRTIFNFVVLCIWPLQIGETIWFLQALLYARLILWVMEKAGLMRYYKVVMVMTVLLMLLLGELAGVIRFHWLGYTAIPGNGLTRALPYMLIGRFMFEKKEKLASIPAWLYVGLFLLGIAASLGEWSLLWSMEMLVYTGHLIGYGIMAFAACGLFLKYQNMRSRFPVVHGRSYSRRIYFLSQPVGHLLLLSSIFLAPQYYGTVIALAGLFVYLICLLLAFVTGYFKFTRRKKRPSKHRRTA